MIRNVYGILSSLEVLLLISVDFLVLGQFTSLIFLVSGESEMGH
jgi:hypothetical protein